MRNIMMLVSASVACVLLVAGCQDTIATVATPRRFDGDKAYAQVEAQMALGPRPVGSDAARATASYIAEQVSIYGWQVERQEFEHRGKSVQNIIARGGGEGSPIIIGAHYDTRPLADRDPERPSDAVPGANDGASGVAVLLELARALNIDDLGTAVWLVFLDGEDCGNLDDWDWSVGAEYLASSLELKPQSVVIVDMIGDRDQQIFMENGSDSALTQQIWSVAQTLGVPTFYPTVKWTIIDDHLPFARRGIPAALLIDFDYPYWHTVQDTSDKVSAESLERVGRVLEYWLEER